MLHQIVQSDPLARLLGAWSMQNSVWTILLRFGLAIVLSAVIGCERASKRHAAGLRTFILVALSAAAVMVLDLSVSEAGGTVPVFSAAALIGIAMISGNSILFSSKNQIKGLTTSVGLWACGILGLCAGAGLYTVTLILFLLMLLVLDVLPKAEVYLKNRSNHFEIHLELTGKTCLQDFATTVRRLGLRIDDIEANPAYAGSGLSVYGVTFTIVSEELKKYKTHKEIIEALATLEYVYHICEC